MTTTTRCETTFADRARRALPDVTPPPLDDRTRRALAASLARFQRGETGEGRVAREVRRLALDPSLQRAIGLFVQEEGRHARILKEAVLALGGTLLREHWAEAAFRRARGALGGRGVRAFELKIGVLLAAEVLGGAYYRLVSRHLPASALASALAQIAGDEADHFVFHRATLRALPGGGGFGRAIALAAIGVGAALVALDQRPALAALGIAPQTWAREVAAQATAIFSRGDDGTRGDPQSNATLPVPESPCPASPSSPSSARPRSSRA